MIMAAEVLAFGTFSLDIRHQLSLDYPRDIGSQIVETLFFDFGVRGSTASHALASVLHVKAWDFSTHFFDGKLTDIAKLTALVGASEAARFRVFRDHDFTFVFLPNG